MRTKEITLYKFKELSKEVQEEVIERERDNLYEFGENWWEFDLEEIQEQIKEEIGVECDNIYFDLQYRGWIKLEGAVIIDENKFLNILTSNQYSKFQLTEKISGSEWLEYQTFSIGKNKFGNFVEVYDEYDYEENEEERELEEELGIDLSKELNDYLSKYLTNLRKSEEWYYSDEKIREELIDYYEDREYTKEGERYN